MGKPAILIVGALTGVGPAFAFAFAFAKKLASAIAWVKKRAKVVVAGRHDEAGKGRARDYHTAPGIG
jgi:hypothetical protein